MAGQQNPQSDFHSARLPAIRVDHCYRVFPCDMPGCDGRGSLFAIDMEQGSTLGHYCEAHSDDEIAWQWRELARRPIITAPTAMLPALPSPRTPATPPAHPARWDPAALADRAPDAQPGDSLGGQLGARLEAFYRERPGERPGAHDDAHDDEEE